MLSQIKKFQDVVKATRTEVKWWSYAAWTLPFVALAAIVLEYYIGYDNWIQKTIWSITLIFFTVSVFWWWWALNKIAVILSALKRSEDDFSSVLYEIKETRKIVRDIDASNREWRESIVDKRKPARRSKSRL